jgi:starch synthase (maltosyl-transferring)
MPVPEETRRVAIEKVRPDVDGGRFAVKRVVDDVVRVEADVFTNGHDEIAVSLETRHRDGRTWKATAMAPLGNDRWAGSFVAAKQGEHRFRIVGWVDELATWRRDIEKKWAAGQDIGLDLESGARLAEEAAKRATSRDADALTVWAQRLREGQVLGTGVPAPAAGVDARVDARAIGALDRLVALARRHPDRSRATTFADTSPIWADVPLARCSAWYEMFPRSASPDPERSGTFADVVARLPYVAELGFDVLYLPPVHPIGHSHRKGPNNARVGQPGDPGSPWAIGAEAGGHTAIHPDLGTLDDFVRLVDAAREQGIEVAIDIAFQTSPDHPWVREHPEWFRHRADGSIAHAENPPKKYEDIYPIDFDSEDWPALWQALRDVVQFWIDQGVRVFRVDNPHTKPFAFWEWLIASVHASQPEVIFLSEAFTRPRVMERLAKVGFTQSYTYFTWRNSKHELIEYFQELTAPEHRDYFRPNVWPNTPDILHETLQHGTRGTFLARFVLAAGLSANYGIYGPTFELQERVAREEGSEEYLDSEKYQVRHWNLERSDSLRHFIAHVNRVRREHPALRRDDTLRFHHIDNDQLICWSKRDPADAGATPNDVVLVVVNLDPQHTQSGWVHLDLDELGVDADVPFDVHDLLTDATYTWRGPHNYVSLDPGSVPAHLFTVLETAS